MRSEIVTEGMPARLPCEVHGGRVALCCTVFSQEAVGAAAALLPPAATALTPSVMEKKAVSLLAGMLVCAMAGSEEPPPHRADGSPYIPGHPELFVSISHCGRAVAAALAGLPIGIDMELIKPLREPVLRRVFSLREREYVLSKPSGQEQDAAFCRVWTAKEAAIKAANGLTLGSVFGIEALPQEQRVSIPPDGERLQLRSVQWRGYALSLCARQPLELPAVMTLSDEQQWELCSRAAERFT